ncbi:hypothetical protein DPMN_044866 [Dreissena polymorpha]|uniref:Uncharacterized protein n=1 Tax=Dreissena polymorpha TaxID=45954 RepID=A0A9D4I0V2_DREPO|nr:hypothetical protein DPMN_044866 [Dreissena polymorpha]
MSSRCNPPVSPSLQSFSQPSTYCFLNTAVRGGKRIVTATLSMTQAAFLHESVQSITRRCPLHCTRFNPHNSSVDAISPREVAYEVKIQSIKGAGSTGFSGVYTRV